VSRRSVARRDDQPTSIPRDGIRRTQMGYEYRPEAVAATVRRVAEVLPGKPIVVTEHGVATADDAERIEFITGGLKACTTPSATGIPLRGYIHWSAFDNFEWALGYAMEFGLIAVDRDAGAQVRLRRSLGDRPANKLSDSIARGQQAATPR
jgi:beta-glucosidase/6-phospho-beta-glucosidase/beta-galactosidase